MKLLRFFGLCSIKEFNESREILLGEIRSLQDLNLELARKMDKLQEQNTKLVFDFDKLLSKYSQGQLNSLFYKLINHCRNNKKFRPLIERWDKRLHNANETLEKKE